MVFTQYRFIRLQPEDIWRRSSHCRSERVGGGGGGGQSAVNDHILALRLFRLITIHLQENIEDTGGIQGRDKPGDTAGGYSRRVTQQGQEG